jgi:stage II sporulation protein R
MPKKYYGIIMIAILILLGTSLYLEEKPLNKSVLRLHVIANSDSLADQALKIQVKDAVVEMMKKEFAGMDNMEQARQAALEDIPEIKRTAEAVVQANGYNYPVQVSLGEYQFPTKSYGNLVLPQGEYQAVRVTIGGGEGKNWWCVLFPPLCMVSSSEQGLSLHSPEEAKVSFKCLELIPKGAKFRTSNH